MGDSEEAQAGHHPGDPARRKFLAGASGVAMAGGLAGGYGTLGWYAVRFLYPSPSNTKRWMFAGIVDRIDDGASVAYTTPSGAPVTIARRGTAGSEQDFIALSSVCPHLGCKVHWQAARNRFFCPCHNGVFDATGLGTEGPPAGQTLARFPLQVVAGLLYIEVDVEGAVAAADRETGRRIAATGRDCANCPGRRGRAV